MAVETELKFRVATRNLKSLANWRIPGGKMGELSNSDLVSTYFDTGKHKLKRSGLTLRVRQNGKANVQTIKSANGAEFGRGEWEAETRSDVPDLREADDTPLEPLASRKLRRKLKPVFKTSVHRTTVPVRTSKSEIELAIDRGRIVAGHRASPIEELELELKSGRPADLFRIARAIERRSGAELDLRTKSDRGYGLARGSEEQVVFAAPIGLDADMTASEAFRVIARATVRHFSANADAVRNLEPEGVHQMRVGLRRLRAAISLFSKVLPHAGTRAVKRELKWLTGELAPAREIDVFITEQVEPITRDRALSRGGKAIKDEFDDKRARALARAKRAVSSERFRALLVDTLEWIEAKPAPEAAHADVPIGKYAADVLRHRTRKARKQGQHLDRLSPRARHKLRIRIKKIRYAVDFFEELFPAKRERRRLKRLSSHLKKIQDALGALNDFVAHRKMAVASALHAPRKNRRARALAAGVVVGREDKAVKPLMKIALKEARRLQAT
ncbi:CYTH and CHAD domain-containing protein [Bradyrhizobium sp. Ai1a-2]|uniref:CYTH and CHAD domain-containing protein n=1 Tax=Bradyrhizobium sp. Ai1a-2 TaxID=196490 RepID=UPI0004048A1D|nr:CYTH and CHAD domain-containing protein [Bradyrhizobium sp. Ai1a-2]